MKPAPEFAALEPEFMAHVKLVSERLGYSSRAKKGEPKRLRRYAIGEVVEVSDPGGSLIQIVR